MCICANGDDLESFNPQAAVNKWSAVAIAHRWSGAQKVKPGPQSEMNSNHSCEYETV